MILIQVKASFEEIGLKTADLVTISMTLTPRITDLFSLEKKISHRKILFKVKASTYINSKSLVNFLLVVILIFYSSHHFSLRIYMYNQWL